MGLHAVIRLVNGDSIIVSENGVDARDAIAQPDADGFTVLHERVEVREGTGQVEYIERPIAIRSSAVVTIV